MTPIPAFPEVTSEWDNEDRCLSAVYSRGGMSLRDYFAAATLQSILRMKGNQFDPKDDAAWCYRVADAMLAEREK